MECVELLINEFHCDINTKSSIGRTILHNACVNGHTSLVRLLVTKYSCHLEARDSNGDTPFTCAGLGGSVECVELLINEFHCDINTKDLNGLTIVHKAYIFGHINLLRLFVAKYGCDLTVYEGFKCSASKDDLNVISNLKKSWNGRSGSGEEVPCITSYSAIVVRSFESITITTIGKYHRL